MCPSSCSETYGTGCGNPVSLVPFSSNLRVRLSDALAWWYSECCAGVYPADASASADK